MSTSADPSADPPRRRIRRAWLLGGALLLTLLVIGAAVVVGGRDGGPAPRGAPEPSTSSPPLDLARAVVRREPLCDRVARAGVRAALAGRVRSLDRYAPGDRVELAPGLRDVADEFGCRYTGVTGSVARVWVFAAPVRLGDARRLARDDGPGCRVLPTSEPFGRAAATSVCPSERPRGRSVTLRGLFGDAWLTCRVAGGSPRPALLARARQWCSTVVRGLAAEPASP